MKLKDFLENYGGNCCISIKGYCEERSYDYYSLPTDYFGEPDEDELSLEWHNGKIPSCLAKESWWDEIKDRHIKHWNIIGGGGYYTTELYVTLEE